VLSLCFLFLLPDVFNQLLSSTSQALIAEHGLILIADDIIKKFLYNFAFMFDILPKKQNPAGIVGLVNQKEALFIFINIIEFVLHLGRLRLEMHQ
jgi:hypothetical protein